MIVVNGQWQGGNDTNTYEAAQCIKDTYLTEKKYCEVEISLEEELVVENGILGYRPIMKQIEGAINLLNIHKPKRLFTVGGGCDADVASILYMNERYNGDLTVVWLDAHGDINSPIDSKSHLSNYPRIHPSSISG